MNSFQRLNKSSFAKALHPETLALHGRELGKSPAVPIWQTAWNENLDASSPHFEHEALDAIYPSVSNPTQAILEDRLAAFEGGVAALALSSGQAASTVSVLNVARASLYNRNRPHQGRWCFGKTPMQTFLDAKPIAEEKMRPPIQTLTVRSSPGFYS